MSKIAAQICGWMTDAHVHSICNAGGKNASLNDNALRQSMVFTNDRTIQDLFKWISSLI
jgi:hypothetical protein